MISGDGLSVGGGQVQRVNVQAGSGNSFAENGVLIAGDYFAALKVRPVAGSWIPSTTQQSCTACVVIGAHLARRLFGHAEHALGRTLSIAAHSVGKPVTVHVMGVAPAGFHGVGDQHAEVWIPHTLFAPLMGFVMPPGAKMQLALDGVPSFVVAPTDLQSGALQGMLARMTATARKRAQAGAAPSAFAGTNTRLIAFAPYSSRPQHYLRLYQRLKLYWLVIALAAVFTVINAWAVGWLVALRRRSRLTTARVLGMTRLHLIVDNAGAALRTWAAAVVAALVLLIAILTILRGELAALGIPHAQLPALGIGVLAWTALILLGVVALQRLPEVAYGWGEPLHGNASRAARGMRKFSGVTVLIETFFVAALSVMAAWALVLYTGMMHANLGIFRQPATVVHIRLRHGYGALSSLNASGGPAISNRLIVQAIERAAADFAPMVKVGFGPAPAAHVGELSGSVSRHDVHMQICEQYVSAGWLAAAQTRILAGRGFSTEQPDPAAVLVDATIARRLFGSPAAAVGQYLDIAIASNQQQSRRIIGVLKTVRLTGANRSHCPLVFNDIRVHGSGMVASGGGDLVITPNVPHARWLALTATINRALARATPALQVKQIEDSGSMIAALYGAQRHLARILFAVAIFTWLMALLGLAVMLRLQHDLQRRVQAIRCALGAGPRLLYGEVLGWALALALAGAVLALLFTPWLAQQFALLSGAQVSPFGWPTWIALAVLLLTVFLVAHFPARRAARAEPAQSLHEL